MMLSVLESAVNIIIDDYLMVSEAQSPKVFEIRLASIGTYACLIWNPGDGSSEYTEPRQRLQVGEATMVSNVVL